VDVVVAAGIVLVGLVGALAALGGSGAQPLPVSRVVVAPPAERLVPVASHTATSSAPNVSAAWVSRVTRTAGIPEPAVLAYAAATLSENRDDPGCHLGWTTLAGIGWVESQHGTIGGRVLENDGRPDRPVFGPELDGRGDVAAIGTEAGGWERATGPLQFLPSTWERWSVDADGDGVADPQDLDDAALAAARYLCAAGGDLETGTGWTAAVRAYNHADAYVQAVYDAASAYATRTDSG
jgi:membrane-bound lytic murein transglycosylase B